MAAKPLAELGQTIDFKRQVREIGLNLDWPAVGKITELDQFLAARRFHEHQFNANVDYHISEKNWLVAKFFFANAPSTIALPSFRGDSAFYTWLYRIAINTAKNYLVAMGRRAPTSTGFDHEEAENFEDAEQLRDSATPEDELHGKQIATTVNKAMEALPEDLRTAITLREIEGLSYEEIANVMNCPIGTVRSRIFRAREAIAAELRPLLGTDKDRRW